MAINLGNDLVTRLNSNYRKPIIEITSSSPRSGTPFQGNYLLSHGNTGYTEEYPNSIVLSNGKIAVITRIYDPNMIGGNGLSLMVSDVDLTSFTKYTEVMGGIGAAEDTDLCELVDGNIGLISLGSYDGDSWYLNRGIVSQTGTTVSAVTNIGYWSGISSSGMSGPTVTRRSDNTYMTAYVRYESDKWNIYTRTSSDFITWASEVKLTIPSVSDILRLFDPNIYKMASGNLMLEFCVVEGLGSNGEEISNIWEMMSTNNGVSWGDASRVTNYTLASNIAKHPDFVETGSNQGNLVFTEEFKSQIINSSSTGWQEDGWAYTDWPYDFSFDPVNRKVYMVAGMVHMGGKTIGTVVKINLDTWSIDRVWDYSTVPHLLTAFRDDGSWWDVTHSEGNKIVTRFYNVISLIDGDNETITNYCFLSNIAGGYYQNVNWVRSHNVTNLHRAWMDNANHRLYCLFVGTERWDWHYIQLGYLDTTQVESGSGFDFTDILLHDVNGGWDLENFEIHIDTNQDLLFLSLQTGYLEVRVLSEPTAIYNSNTYSYATNPSFPASGLRLTNGNVVSYNNKLYSGFGYNNTVGYGQENFRGLCIIDLGSHLIRYTKPSDPVVDDFGFRGMTLVDNNRILMGSWSIQGRIYEYNISSDTWTWYDGLSGLNCQFTAYDSLNDLILSAWPSVGFFGGNVSAVVQSINGNMKKVKYIPGTYNSGTWTWNYGTSDYLVSGSNDHDAAVILKPGTTSMMAFWVEDNWSYYYGGWVNSSYVMWDQAVVSLSLSQYISRDDDIVRETSTKGPNTLSFALTDGRKFDPINTLSMLSVLVKKGRLISVRFGEDINGTPNWVEQGQFLVTQVSLEYRKMTNPNIKVNCEDIRTLWNQHNIQATPFYQNKTPKYILDDVIPRNCNLVTLSNLQFPTTFNNQININKQWLDTNLGEIIDQILHRFGYFLKMNGDGTITAVRIGTDVEYTVGESPDFDTHIYTVDGIIGYIGSSEYYKWSNTIDLIAYSPDDSFSDYTNRVVVTGEDPTDIELVHDEEVVGHVAGTTGWWGAKNEFQVWYSDNHSRRCRNPRLDIKEARMAGLLAATFSNIDISIMDNSYDDPIEYNHEKYCTVVVDSPDLTAALFAFGSMFIVDFLYLTIPDVAPTTGGPTWRIGTFINNLEFLAVMDILATVGNFQVDVWACPITTQRRSIQGVANDSELQVEVGEVERKVDDSLCGSEGECTTVAQWELLIAQLQRRRIKIEKLGHYRDEEGDSIKITHPYNGQLVRMYIDKLTRTITLGKIGDETGGKVIDVIEGWKTDK